MALTITVEDGTIVAGANTYVDPEGSAAEDYFDAHLYATAWTGAVLADQQKAVIMATRYLDKLVDWKGFKVDTAQPREWPRTGVLINGDELPDDVVPADIVEAVLETALAFLTGNRIADTAKSTGVSSIGLGNGALTLDFNEPDLQRNLPILPEQVTALISKYGNAPARGFQMIPVSR